MVAYMFNKHNKKSLSENWYSYRDGQSGVWMFLSAILKVLTLLLLILLSLYFFLFVNQITDIGNKSCV